MPLPSYLGDGSMTYKFGDPVECPICRQWLDFCEVHWECDTCHEISCVNCVTLTDDSITCFRCEPQKEDT
jgi:hypothetical protein